MDAEKTWKVELTITLSAAVAVKAACAEDAEDVVENLWGDDAEFGEAFLHKAQIVDFWTQGASLGNGLDITIDATGETRN